MYTEGRAGAADYFLTDRLLCKMFFMKSSVVFSKCSAPDQDMQVL